MRRLGGLAGLVVFSIICGRGLAQRSVDEGFSSTLEGMIKAHQGKVAVYARQLNSGHEIAIDADEPVQTASVIKVAMYLLIFVRLWVMGIVLCSKDNALSLV